MGDPTRYFFAGFVVVADSESYLVVVEPARSDITRLNIADDLPDWTFESPLAIWITNDNASIYARSMDGDRFRRHLSSQRRKSAGFQQT